MKGITALGNEEINKLLKKELEIIGKDIQYQEAVLDVLEKNENVEFLILSSIIPGQFNIYEFINLIIFKNSKIKIIIFLEKRNKELEDFLISKGINNIYYNNEITIQEIINNIKNNKNIKYEIKKINKTKIIKNIKNKLIKKFIKLNKKEKNKKIKKIITIIGAPKIGKTIFSIIFCLINKNKKILLIKSEKNKNIIKIILGKNKENKIYKKRNITKMTKNADIMFLENDRNEEELYMNLNNCQKNIKEYFNKYDYIIFDVNEHEEMTEILKDSNEIILLCEANLLGISDAKNILKKIIYTAKTQKDKVKIVFNKHNLMSINMQILKVMFEDFKILGILHYDKNYNCFINSNAKILMPKVKKEFLKIVKKMEWKWQKNN